MFLILNNSFVYQYNEPRFLGPVIKTCQIYQKKFGYIIQVIDGDIDMSVCSAVFSIVLKSMDAKLKVACSECEVFCSIDNAHSFSWRNLIKLATLNLTGLLYML